MRAQFFCFALLILSALQSCETRSSPGPVFDSLAVAQHRIGKDSLFHSDASPLLPRDMVAFKGLAYFQIDSSYAFQVTLEGHLNPARIIMIDSKGNQRDYLEHGLVRFNIDGPHTLTVYKADPPILGHESLLFIPFKDGTNGKETYSAGRYLELNERKGSNRYLLDFNRAYSPLCAYNESYACPYPPVANHLEIDIKAGERSLTDIQH